MDLRRGANSCFAHGELLLLKIGGAEDWSLLLQCGVARRLHSSSLQSNSTNKFVYETQSRRQIRSR
uniref:Uncharacterized protein n=1 Tax=Physcomitrium patens TaxID=3218 RepID=A0A2K1KXC3_PHYPA|nr:hypothetical protein PHYPA_005423 [Physcomitrium patens]